MVNFFKMYLDFYELQIIKGILIKNKIYIDNLWLPSFIMQTKLGHQKTFICK